MTLFEQIVLDSGLLLESAQSSEITDAILNFRPARIKYRTNGEDYKTGARLIYPVAYGLTTAGNPVVRAFEPKGETTTEVPAWKFFRVDRIISWKTLTKTASGQDYHFNPETLSGLNKAGDRSMSEIYAIAPYGKAKEKGSWMSRLKGKAVDFFNRIVRKKQDPAALSEPVSKSQIKGSDENKAIEKSVKNKVQNSYANTSDIVNNIVDNVADNVDKENKGVYLNNDNPVFRAMTAPESTPVTRDEVKPDNEQESPTESGATQTSKEQITEPDDKPVSKDEVEDNNMNKISDAYKDMMRRWGFTNEGKRIDDGRR